MSHRPQLRHVLLYVSSSYSSPYTQSELPGSWYFALRNPLGKLLLQASDEEPDSTSLRLQLWALVRGLEAIDGPRHVTVYSCSRFITEGLTFHLPRWRRNRWRWEHFGHLVPIRHHDLWQRIDAACRVHEVDCQLVPASLLGTPSRLVSQQVSDEREQILQRQLRIDRAHQHNTPPVRRRRRGRSSTQSPTVGQTGIITGRRLT